MCRTMASASDDDGGAAAAAATPPPPPNRFLCEICAGRFSRKYTLQRHMERAHSGLMEQFPCEYCKLTFDDEKQFRLHVRQHRASKTFTRTAHSLNLASQYERTFKTARSFDYVFNKRKGISEVIQRELLRKNVVKASLDLLCTFTKLGPDGNTVDKITVTLCSKFYTLHRMEKLTAFVKQCKMDIHMRLEDLTLRGSNWTLHRIHKMRISTVKVKDLVGGCESGGKIIVRKLKRGKYLVNPPSLGNGCFYSCIAYHMTKSMEQSVLTQYIADNFVPSNKSNSFNEPMRTSQIAKFERRNKHLNIAINVVYCNDKGSVFPVYCSKNRKATHRISLVLHFAKQLQEMGHYMYIADFNKYASFRYYTKSDRVAYVPGYYCHNCLQRFKRKSTFKNHIAMCNENRTQKVIIPPKDTFMEFDCLRKSYPLPLIGFADFEAAMTECEYCSICSDARKCTHSTTYINEHKPFAFCLMIFDRNNEIVLEFTYAGDDCVERLLTCLLENEDRLKALFNKNLPMTFTENDRVHFESTSECALCGRDIVDIDIKVKHHEHYTSKYIGPAHAHCNLGARLYDCTIPIFFHNLAGYDANFIIQGLGKLKKGSVRTLKVLPHNTEKIRKLDLNSFSFLDSLDFLSGSLAAITNDLVLSKHDFPLLAKTNMYETAEQKALLLRKGVFPYGMVRDYMQLFDIQALPGREAFYSDLSQQHISEEDYQHAKLMWKEFKCKNLLEYAFLYLRLDVALLAEAFLKFRNLLIDEENLDCCQFLSTPHLSFHLMLKITKVQLQHLSDPSMIDFVEKNIRGKFMNAYYKI